MKKEPKISPVPQKIPFSQVVDALLNESKPFPARLLYRLSDLEGPELETLTETWPKISTRRRQAVLEDLEEIGETDLVLSFEAIFRLALGDADSSVRATAAHGLWDYELVDLIPTFLHLMESDPAAEVRAASASALGKFVYLGEIEEISQETLDEITDQLLSIYNSGDAAGVRQKALESLGFSSRPEVTPVLESAYYSGKKDWMVSALFAMGRTAHARWQPLVLDALTHDDDEIRFEAARAAGELELKAAREPLMAMLQDPEKEVRLAVIWSLSQIGGLGVAELLEELADETEDEDELDLIDSAIDNLEFTNDLEMFSLLELGEDEEDEDNFDMLEDEDEGDLEDETGGMEDEDR